MAQKDDGKIRMRCTGCGKRVKFPKGRPGDTFRCPLCHTMMVAPIDNGNGATPQKSDTLQAAPKARPASPRVTATPRRAAAPREPEKMPEPIARINAFLSRETTHVGEIGRNVLMDNSLSPEEQIAELRRLRHAKAVNLRKFVQVVLKDLDQKLKALHDNPAAETPTLKAQIKALEKERHCLITYLKVMFELRTLSESPSAKSDTPEAESAPPSTP